MALQPTKAQVFARKMSTLVFAGMWAYVGSHIGWHAQRVAALAATLWGRVEEPEVPP